VSPTVGPPSSPATSPSGTSPPGTSPPAPGETGVPSGGGPLPTRDELTVAWGDAILPTLGRAKPRWAPGRWVAVEGDTAVFALPNAIHAAKCEEGRGHVEAAVAAHFGRPVPIRVVVDAGGAETPGRGSARTDAEPPPPDEPDTIDLSELTDATDVAASGVERVARAFPGAELVDGD
jgi:DNA polymerase III subunit gamma/tau